MSKENIFKQYFDNVKFLDIIIFLIVILFFHLCYGLQIINPTNINWIMSVYHDWGQHYLGWAFYRNDPWTFPLGAIESYNYPVGTNIGFMDSIPLLGLLFKPFSSILPDDFQYLGIWLFICSYFVAFYTKKILQLYKVSNWIILLAVILMIANPVLLFRSIHPALSSHFLILGSIYNHLKPSFGNSKKINLNQIFLFFIAATVNPYIMVMIFGFNVIIPFKHFWIEKTSTLKQTILYPIISILLFVIFWIIIGMIEFSKGTSVASAEPFSLYSFNLNSFFDGYGFFSKILPDLGRMTPNQYEGFAYLGVGMMALILIGFIYTIYLLFKKRIQYISIKKWSLLLFLCLASLLFAITNVISFNSEIIATLPLPKIIEKLGFIFRASGRFVWPFYYLLFIGSIIVLVKMEINKYFKLAILSSITLIQLYDIQGLITHWDLPSGSYKTPLQNEKWIKVFKNFDEVIIYPSFDYNYSINYHNDYQDLSFLALKSNISISNGYVARANVGKAQKFINFQDIELNRGVISNNRLYITTEKNIGSFSTLMRKGIIDIQKMDDFIFIFKKNVNLTSQNFNNDAKTKTFLDSITKYYKNYKATEFEKINHSLVKEDAIKFNFDNFSFDKNLVVLRGWAFDENNIQGDNFETFLIVQNEINSFKYKLNTEQRPDISEFFKKTNLDNSGFKSVIPTDKLPNGNYAIGIMIKRKDSDFHYIMSEKNITVK